MSNRDDLRAVRATGPEPRIQSVGRIAAILKALLAAPNGVLQLGELARACGLIKTTAFTLVDSLVCVGLVNREEFGGYRLGLHNLAYGRAVERHLNIASIAGPGLLKLCALTRETVNLALPRPLEAFIVQSFEGSQNLRVARAHTGRNKIITFEGHYQDGSTTSWRTLGDRLRTPQCRFRTPRGYKLWANRNLASRNYWQCLGTTLTR